MTDARCLNPPNASAQRLIADNRKAFHDYHILETFEAGIVLLGTEVKSIREGRVNLRDSYARVETGEVWVYNVHISPYCHRGYADHEPTRRRKLLLHKQEIRKLIGKTVEKGMTLVPAAALFQERQGQDGDQPRQGQAGARQARRDPQEGGRPRNARSDEGARPLTSSALLGGFGVPRLTPFQGAFPALHSLLAGCTCPLRSASCGYAARQIGLRHYGSVIDERDETVRFHSVRFMLSA